MSPVFVLTGAQPGTQSAQLAAPPPPLPTAPMFHVGIDGQSGGPYTTEQVARAAAQG